MATPYKAVSVRSKASGLVQGRSLAELGQGVQLVKVGRSDKTSVKKGDLATVLVRKAAKALSKPGIREGVVFRGPHPSKVYAYSVLTSDTTRLVRQSSDGKRVIGHFVNGKFRALKA